MGFLAAVLSLSMAAWAPGYSEIASAHGVTVYRKKDTRIIDLLAEGTIAAPPERVLAVLIDYPRHPTFMKHMAEIRVLARGPGWLRAYQRMDLPVLKDRDVVLQVTWGNDGQGAWMRFACASDPAAPPQPDAVRVTRHAGVWHLQPVELPGGGHGTYARYQMYIDLGGSLPGWMARAQGGKDVPDLFEAIRRQAR